MNESMIRDINLAEEGKQRYCLGREIYACFEYTERRILR